ELNALTRASTGCRLFAPEAPTTRTATAHRRAAPGAPDFPRDVRDRRPPLLRTTATRQKSPILNDRGTIRPARRCHDTQTYAKTKSPRAAGDGRRPGRQSARRSARAGCGNRGAHVRSSARALQRAIAVRKGGPLAPGIADA